MAASDVTLNEVRRLLDLASTEIGNGNYGTAEGYAMQAQAVVAGLPDSSKGDISITHRSNEIASLLKQIRRKRKGALGPFQKKYVEYVRPDD